MSKNQFHPPVGREAQIKAAIVQPVAVTPAERGGGDHRRCRINLTLIKTTHDTVDGAQILTF